MHQQFIHQPDFEWLVLDSTIIRAHPCTLAHPGLKGASGAGSRLQQRWVQYQNSLDFMLTGGKRNDVTQAPTRLAGRHGDYVIADKRYDASSVIEQIEALGALPVIPARKHWRAPRYYDKHLYRERHVAEAVSTN
jgi:hypothetical protein